MQFDYLLLLGMALMRFQQPVFAKRGASSHADKSGGELPLGKNLQPHCYAVPAPSNPSYVGLNPNPTRSWLHQWVGTYYNGSIEVKIIIDDNSQTCNDQNGVLTHSYNGVLAIAKMPAGVDGGNLSPFIFLLSGWEQETAGPTGDIEPLNSYLPSDVTAYMNSITNPRNEYWNGSVSWLLEASQHDDGYEFTGLVDYSPDAPPEDSNWEFDFPPCNGSESSLFDMHPFDALDITYDSEADYTEARNKVNGIFDPSKATVTWTGGVIGTFQDLRSPGGLKFGRYWITFTGTVDSETSHTLVTTGRSPSWEIVQELSNNTTTTGADASTATCVAFSSAAPFKSGLGKAAYGLAVLAMVVTISL